MTKNNTNTLKKSVLATLAYYRTVRTPLTLVQIGRYLISNNKGDQAFLSEIKHVLDDLLEKDVIIEQKGLYWLKTNSAPHQRTWLKFIQLEKIAQRKINTVRKALKIFSTIPFLRGIFICGSVARKVSRPESDIDFLILTKQNRVWIVRLLITVFAFLLGKKTNDSRFPREQTGSRKNKFCLNHYRSSSKLKLEEDLRDLYSAQEYSRMINIYSTNKIERKFFKKNKEWMKKYLPNFSFTKLPLYNGEDYQNFGRSLQKIFENMLSGKIGNIIEKLLQLLQVEKIKISGKEFPTSRRRVITNDEVIMFHLNPRAFGVINTYEKICQKLIHL